MGKRSDFARRPMDAEYLRSRLRYDQETGVFIWRSKPDESSDNKRWNTRHSGSQAGAVDGSGYIHIRIDAGRYKAHLLAWLYVFGEWPQTEIDHRDRNRTNNRIGNLREATDQQNAANRGVRSDSKSGIKGIRWDVKRNSWIAQISIGGKRKTLGRFISRDAAAGAYSTAAQVVHGEFALDGGCCG